MYNFILSMWYMKKVDADRIQRYVPVFITQAEANAILATPQYEE